MHADNQNVNCFERDCIVSNHLKIIPSSCDRSNTITPNWISYSLEPSCLKTLHREHYYSTMSRILFLCRTYACTIIIRFFRFALVLLFFGGGQILINYRNFVNYYSNKRRDFGQRCPRRYSRYGVICNESDKPYVQLLRLLHAWRKLPCRFSW